MNSQFSQPLRLRTLLFDNVDYSPASVYQSCGTPDGVGRLGNTAGMVASEDDCGSIVRARCLHHLTRVHGSQCTARCHCLVALINVPVRSLPDTVSSKTRSQPLRTPSFDSRRTMPSLTPMTLMGNARWQAYSALYICMVPGLCIKSRSKSDPRLGSVGRVERP